MEPKQSLQHTGQGDPLVVATSVGPSAIHRATITLGWKPSQVVAR